MCLLAKIFYPAGIGGNKRSCRRSTIQFCFLTKFQTYKQNATIIKGTILYPDKPIVYVLSICFISTSIYSICCHFCEVFESKMNTLCYFLKLGLFPKNKDITTVYLAEFKVNKRLFSDQFIDYIQISLNVPFTLYNFLFPSPESNLRSHSAHSCSL